MTRGPDGRSAAVDKGEVMATTPAPSAGGGRLGSTVSIQVSFGVPQVTVPDVTGMNAAEATAMLQQAGLKVRGHHVLRRQRAPAEPDPPARSSTRAPPCGSWSLSRCCRARRAPIGAHIQIRVASPRAASRTPTPSGPAPCRCSSAIPAAGGSPTGDPTQDALFTAGCAERGVPSFIHTPFLVNVGSPTEATVEQSLASIAHNLARGAQLGCQGVVVHAGSAVGEDRYEAALRQLRERLLPVLDVLPAEVRGC